MVLISPVVGAIKTPVKHIAPPKYSSPFSSMASIKGRMKTLNLTDKNVVRE